MAGADAFGTLFKRGDGATPTESFTTIANVTTIGGPERSRNIIDVTSHDSPDQWMEKIGGLKDGGQITVDINYDPRQTTHDLDDDFDDADPRNYQIVLFPGTADEHTWTIAGVMTGVSDEFPHDDKMGRTLTIDVSGKPVLAATGS
ncbi:phage tail tube protein [Mangrovihabitans endophyticus]|uniref:Lambda phage tail tube protein N-terminal domain-containing protein n=1 Tax=Mangrovihabitans endophyticus TaxID=1751298 RepID=A0A8J3BYI8_9ACTN|nr:phage tail tube protein [Mangrovihabitans endophyticus]GGK89136.1 hypothetical protein GCM10012284_23970 [Mangrovihabitans endophyticus]